MECLGVGGRLEMEKVMCYRKWVGVGWGKYLVVFFFRDVV